ncbi:MAG: hypothetical protein ACI82F_003547 [Planctomycetota bacterium]
MLEFQRLCQGAGRRRLPILRSLSVPTARAKYRPMDPGLDLHDNQDVILFEDQVQLCLRRAQPACEGAVAPGAEV